MRRYGDGERDGDRRCGLYYLLPGRNEPNTEWTLGDVALSAMVSSGEAAS